MSDDELKELYGGLLARRARMPRDRCVPPEDLRAVAESAASADERLRVMEHVSGCPPCQRELALLGTVVSAAGSAERASWARWLVLAASVAAIALGARAFRGGEQSSPAMRVSEPVVRLVSPFGYEALPVPAPLVWRTFPGATRYEVEVLDLDGALIHAVVARDTTDFVPEGVGLGPGRAYQWRVTAVRADGARVESPVVPFIIA